MTTSLLDIIHTAIERSQQQMHVAFPAKVISYDASAQTVEVEPQLFDVRRDINEERVAEPIPVLANVPVSFPRGGGFAITLPIEAGDFVTILCADYSLDRWRQKGNAGDPGDIRKFTLAGAIALPGVYPTGDEFGDASGSNLIIGKDGGLNITVTATQMQVGGSSDAAALASKVDALEAAFNSHIHVTTATIGASGTPGTISPTATPSNQSPYASAVLKVGS